MLLADVKDEISDDMTGLALDTALVKAAKRGEMDFMAKLNVWCVNDNSSVDDDRLVHVAG